MVTMVNGEPQEALEMSRWMKHHSIGLIKRKKIRLQWCMEHQGELLRLEETVSPMGDSVGSPTLSRQPIHPHLIPDF